MKKFLLISYFMMTLAGCGQEKPDAYDANHQPIILSHYLGQWVVINYWANWCLSCLEELPELQALSQHYKNQVIVLGVSFDGLSNESLRELAAQWHISFPLLSRFPLDKFDIHETFPTVPVTLIINPKGKLIYVLRTEQTEASLVDVLRLK